MHLFSPRHSRSKLRLCSFGLTKRLQKPKQNKNIRLYEKRIIAKELLKSCKINNKLYIEEITPRITNCYKQLTYHNLKVEV